MPNARVVKFLISGLFSLFASFITFICVHYVSGSIWVSLLLCNFVHIFLQYFLQKNWVFRARGTGYILRYLLVVVGLIIVNGILLDFMKMLGLGVYLSQALLLPIMAIASYFLQQSFTFKDANG